MHKHARFIPAAGHDLALPLYDPLVRLMGADRAREALFTQVRMAPGQRVLDIGCGTGTLAVWLARTRSGVDVVGLDPDQRALARATRKAERAGVRVRFEQGFAETLPFEAATFDHVVSSFMLHHLEPETKAQTLREVQRVLKPGSAFHLLDFDAPEHGVHGVLQRLLHARGGERANHHLDALLEEAGFVEVTRRTAQAVLFQPVVALSARRRP